jgi:Tol biopolymer transport system component
MGEVYRALDTQLQRDVALKLLPDGFSTDPDRLARFQREAQVLASLNHSNIAQIYGLDGSGASRCIVMELVEGETLQERIAGRPMPITEALPIAKQIAEALESAHERGIVHRDLKPANIKVTADGKVKVLDFGLAKALENAPGAAELSNSPTISIAATNAGVILGTAPYMSPEQARGKAVDKRTDVWAFGCVLYEMLTGEKAFKGEDVSDVLAAVIRADVDFGKLSKETPPAIWKLLQRCLQKDRNERLPDIGSARLEINDALKAVPEAAPVVVPIGGTRRPLLSNTRIAWLAALVCLIAVAVLGWWIHSTRAPADAHTYRASLLPPDGGAWAVATPASRFALSPDGRRLAFIGTNASGRQQIWVRFLDGLTAQPLSGTDNTLTLFWSPDSRYIAFGAGGKLRKIDASGGPPLTLADMTGNNGGSWNHNDVILFPPTPQSTVFRVSASGGSATPVTTLDAEAGDQRHWQPFFLPDDRHFLYHAVGSKAGGSNDGRAVYIGSLDPSEKSKLLIQGGSNAQYASGYILFLRESTLMAQPFDLKKLALTGEAVPVAEQVQLGGSTGRSGAFSVSQTGTLVYQTGDGGEVSELSWFDAMGKKVGTLGTPGDYGDISLSADGKQAAVSVLDPLQRTRDIWLFDVTRGLRTRFTFSASDEFAPVWSPDGMSIIFSSRPKGPFDLYRKASNGAGDEELLFADQYNKFPTSVSRDGQFLLYFTNATTGIDIWVLPLKGDRKPFQYLKSPFVENWGYFSPDAKWVAYVSNESGRNEVYVSPFPDPRGKWQISAAGGSMPHWSSAGKTIYYTGPDNKVFAVDVNAQGNGFQVGASHPIFDAVLRTNQRSPYDVTPGSRFLANAMLEKATPTPITLLVNWPALVKK